MTWVHRSRSLYLGPRGKLARHAPAMYLARTIVNTEGAHVGENAHDRALISDTHAAHNLNRAVHYAPLGLGAHHLGATGFKITFLTLIE